MRSTILLLAFNTLLCGPLAVAEEELTSENRHLYDPYSEAIGRAAEVVLYEGLPHPQSESALYQRERKSKRNIKLYGHSFYARTLALSEEHADQLKQLFTEPTSFSPFAGKFCGGFHPDYCVEYRDGKRVYRVLLCFGCHEVKFFGEKKFFHCDLRDKPYSTLKSLLESYRQSRPKPADD
jgi:hypothetical protein